MSPTPPERPDVAACARRLHLAAGELLEAAGAADAVPELPTTIAHLEVALDWLATSLVRMSQAVGDWSAWPSSDTDYRDLPSEARALRWHLHDVAAHLRASSNACPAALWWAREVVAGDPDVRE
jgi:hypothetical protein